MACKLNSCFENNKQACNLRQYYSELIHLSGQLACSILLKWCLIGSLNVDNYLCLHSFVNSTNYRIVNIIPKCQNVSISRTSLYFWQCPLRVFYTIVQHDSEHVSKTLNITIQLTYISFLNLNALGMSGQC